MGVMAVVRGAEEPDSRDDSGARRGVPDSQLRPAAGEDVPPVGTEPGENDPARTVPPEVAPRFHPVGTEPGENDPVLLLDRPAQRLARLGVPDLGGLALHGPEAAPAARAEVREPDETALGLRRQLLGQGLA